MHISSLASPFPILYLTSLCLFCTYQLYSQINRDRLTGENQIFNTCAQGIYINMKIPKTVSQIVYVCYFGQKESRVGAVMGLQSK